MRRIESDDDWLVDATVKLIDKYLDDLTEQSKEAGCTGAEARDLRSPRIRPCGVLVRNLAHYVLNSIVDEHGVTLLVEEPIDAVQQRAAAMRAQAESLLAEAAELERSIHT